MNLFINYMMVPALFKLLLLWCLSKAAGKCLSSDSLEAEFISFFDDPSVTTLPTDGSCCQSDICGIPCSADDEDVANGYGIAVIVAIVFFCFVGLAAAYTVGNDVTQFFVASRTLGLPVVILTLASQCIDANAVLGEIRSASRNERVSLVSRTPRCASR